MDIQKDSNVTINGDVFNDNASKIVYNYSDKKEEKPMTDIELLRKIKYTQEKVKLNHRLWFPVCCYMMWRGRVAQGDFKSAVEILEQLVPDLKLDSNDMSRCYVYSFRKQLDLWDVNDAPVKGETFSKYVQVANLMYEG